MSESEGYVEVRKDGTVFVRYVLVSPDGVRAEGGFIARRGSPELSTLIDALGRLSPGDRRLLPASFFTPGR